MRYISVPTVVLYFFQRHCVIIKGICTYAPFSEILNELVTFSLKALPTQPANECMTIRYLEHVLKEGERNEMREMKKRKGKTLRFMYEEILKH